MERTPDYSQTLDCPFCGEDMARMEEHEHYGINAWGCTEDACGAVVIKPDRLLGLTRPDISLTVSVEL